MEGYSMDAQKVSPQNMTILRSALWLPGWCLGYVIVCLDFRKLAFTVKAWRCFKTYLGRPSATVFED